MMNDFEGVGIVNYVVVKNAACWSKRSATHYETMAKPRRSSGGKVLSSEDNERTAVREALNLPRS